MLFGVKANVGSNPTVTANEKAPTPPLLLGSRGLLLALDGLIGKNLRGEPALVVAAACELTMASWRDRGMPIAVRATIRSDRQAVRKRMGTPMTGSADNRDGPRRNQAKVAQTPWLPQRRIHPSLSCGCTWHTVTY
jgi:hypothetical protein